MVGNDWMIAGGAFVLGVVFSPKIREILPNVFPMNQQKTQEQAQMMGRPLITIHTER